MKAWKEHYNVRFINASDGGAKIEGTEIMTLSEVIATECVREVNISECISQLSPIFDNKQQEKIESYFMNTSKRVHQIVVLAQQGYILYQKLEKLCKSGNMDKTVYVKLLKKIKKNRKEIEKNENFQLLSETMVDAEQIIRSSQYFQYDSIEEEGLELARQGKGYMKLLEDYAKILEKLAEEVFNPA